MAAFASRTTNIVGLDLILGGGIPPATVLMILGRPGVGKTTLSQQLAFTFAAQYRRTTPDSAPSAASGDDAPPPKPVIYFSTFSESNDALLAHMRGFRFFDDTLIGDHIQLLSLTGDLERSLESTAQTILTTARKTRTPLVVIDGFGTNRSTGATGFDLTRFLYRISSGLRALGTTLIIGMQTDVSHNEVDGYITTADAVISLESRSFGARRVRRVEVIKFRGQPQLLGAHSYAITDDGLVFYPRLESLPRVPTNPPLPSGMRERISFGLTEFDSMLEGGLPSHSSTVIAGAPGTGKTALSLHYLREGVRQGKAGLFIGFYENAREVQAKAAALGIDIVEAVANGTLVLQTYAPVELDVDEIAADMRRRIAAQPIERVVVDGFSELARVCDLEGRGSDFTAAWVTLLKEQGITALYTHTIRKALGTDLDLSDTPVAALADNLLLLRHLEYNARLYRILSVLKMRDSAFDPTIREFVVAAGQGVRVLQPLQSAGGLLGGIAQQNGGAAPTGNGQTDDTGTGRG